MKSPILFLCLAGLLSGCSVEPDTGALPGTALPDLQLIKTRSMIPSSTLQDHTFAVFQNASGKEKKLAMTINDGVQLQDFQNFKYYAESLTVSYSDRDDATYVPMILARAQYRDLTNHNEFIQVALNTDANHNYIPTIVLCPDPECPFFEDFHESIEIAGLPFSRVYGNYAPPPQFNSFAKVYYTLDQGIVGFQGYDGEMWAMVRFE